MTQFNFFRTERSSKTLIEYKNSIFELFKEHAVNEFDIIESDFNLVNEFVKSEINIFIFKAIKKEFDKNRSNLKYSEINSNPILEKIKFQMCSYGLKNQIFQMNCDDFLDYNKITFTFNKFHYMINSKNKNEINIKNVSELTVNMKDNKEAHIVFLKNFEKYDLLFGKSNISYSKSKLIHLFFL